jgi:putative ABC transport system permease protein
MPLAEALATDGLPGIVMQRLLVDRLALAWATLFASARRISNLRAVLETEPDGAAGGFALGPRSIVRLDALEASGLLGTRHAIRHAIPPRPAR